VKDDEDTCNALGDEDSCNGNSVCSWCKAGAVADACHSIENAKFLPPAVFSCSKLGFLEQERFIQQAEKMMANAMDQFDRMAQRFNRIPAAFNDVRATPQEQCETYGKADCKANGCSWCDAAAVKAACNSIENAGFLPPAVFTCDPLPSNQNQDDDESEDDEEEPQSLWGQFVKNMHGGRRGRHHEGRPEHGGRHHGGRRHGGRHQRGPPPPPMEDDEEESFYGRPPMVKSER